MVFRNKNCKYFDGKYFDGVANGEYSVKFKVPNDYPDAIKNPADFKLLWPYCFFKEFNK